MKNSLSNDKESVVNAFATVQPVSETGCIASGSLFSVSGLTANGAAAVCTTSLKAGTGSYQCDER
jgi:hypothetical protein